MRLDVIQNMNITNWGLLVWWKGFSYWNSWLLAVKKPPLLQKHFDVEGNSESSSGPAESQCVIIITETTVNCKWYIFLVAASSKQGSTIGYIETECQMNSYSIDVSRT